MSNGFLGLIIVDFYDRMMDPLEGYEVEATKRVKIFMDLLSLHS